MRTIDLTITFTEFCAGDLLPEADQALIERARLAAGRSYAPYSGFAVGAALKLANGEVVEGNNQENAAFPSGLCAERVAVYFAQSKYPDVPILSMAVAVRAHGAWLKDPVPPCGACLQALSETQNRSGLGMRVILSGSEKTWILADGRNLLPLSFDPGYLKP